MVEIFASDSQIVRMRQLLDHVIQVSKRQQEEQEARRLATEFMRSKSVCETSDVIGFGDDENYHSDAGKDRQIFHSVRSLSLAEKSFRLLLRSNPGFPRL